MTAPAAPHQRVAIVDYGIGNVRSVANACARAGVEAERVHDGAALAELRPDRIVLPGVGAVGEALSRLRDRGFEPVLNELVRVRGLPFLGICVGMQVLAEVCEEFGQHRGLGWIPGRVARLDRDDPSLRVPHVGWNTARPVDPDDPLLRCLDERDVYFVHSYAFRCDDPAAVAAWTDYGGPFASAVRCASVCAVQFHPEKSGPAGQRFLEAFLEARPC
jgi:glutamine amidotransferase